MLRWVLGGVACLIAGAMLLSRYLSGLPPLDQLTAVSGDVVSADVEERRSRRSKSKHLVVRIGDKPAAYYVDRFPEYEQVVGSIKAGDRVTAWVDVGNNNYIWQLDKGDKRIVSYEQVAAAQRSNDSGNALFGVLFLVFGVGTIGVMFWKWRTASTATETLAEPPASP